MRQLKGLEELSYDGMIPVELIKAVDQGRHPDLWYRELLDSLAQGQKDSQAKVKALRGYQAALQTELGLQPTSNTDAKTIEEDIIVD